MPITASIPPSTPPRWLNALMRMMLWTPGLQRLLGRSTALITFTGRRSGRTFTTPVTYFRIGERVIVTAHRSRRWWRNLEDQPIVGLRLAGRTHSGKARVRGDPRDALSDLVTYLEGRPRAAKGMGAALDTAGRLIRWRRDDSSTTRRWSPSTSSGPQ